MALEVVSGLVLVAEVPLPALAEDGGLAVAVVEAVDEREGLPAGVEARAHDHQVGLVDPADDALDGLAGAEPGVVAGRVARVGRQLRLLARLELARREAVHVREGPERDVVQDPPLVRAPRVRHVEDVQRALVRRARQLVPRRAEPQRVDVGRLGAAPALRELGAAARGEYADYRSLYVVGI